MYLKIISIELILFLYSIIMSNLSEAFRIPINSENKYFVDNPYIPFPSLVYSIKPNPIDYVMVRPQALTVGRCFDIKYGATKPFYPSYDKNKPFYHSYDKNKPFYHSYDFRN